MESLLSCCIPELNPLDELSFFDVDEVIATPYRRIMILSEGVLIDESDNDDSHL